MSGVSLKIFAERPGTPANIRLLPSAPDTPDLDGARAKPPGASIAGLAEFPSRREPLTAKFSRRETRSVRLTIDLCD